MSTADQSHAAALHGEALLQAQRSELHALIADLEALANRHDDTRVEVAGTIARAWSSGDVLESSKTSVKIRSAAAVLPLSISACA